MAQRLLVAQALVCVVSTHVGIGARHAARVFLVTIKCSGDLVGGMSV